VGSNATADAASLVISKGFLVYNVLVTDSNFLLHRIIVDAGNGTVSSKDIIVSSNKKEGLRGSPSLVGRGIANPMSERTRGFEMLPEGGTKVPLPAPCSSRI
jgi:hypothetical protein